MGDGQQSGERQLGTQTNDVIRETIDWSEGSPSIAIVKTLAEAVGRDPTALDPLYDTVDPTALDSLLLSNGTRSNRGLIVRFVYQGLEIAIDGDGSMTIRVADPAADSA